VADTDVLVSANAISISSYRYRLSAKWISAKYMQINWDIGQNIGHDIGQILAKETYRYRQKYWYRLGKNFGIGKNISSEKLSVLAQPISV
jgi:hypothetical protein